MDKELQEIADELQRIEYGELHIIVRGGEIVSYTSIKSKLRPSNKKSEGMDEEWRNTIEMLNKGV